MSGIILVLGRVRYCHRIRDCNGNLLCNARHWLCCYQEGRQQLVTWYLSPLLSYVNVRCRHSLSPTRCPVPTYGVSYPLSGTSAPYVLRNVWYRHTVLCAVRYRHSLCPAPNRAYTLCPEGGCEFRFRQLQSTRSRSIRSTRTSSQPPPVNLVLDPTLLHRFQLCCYALALPCPVLRAEC
eukprot:3012815-Rhodomonas_salina.1